MCVHQPFLTFRVGNTSFLSPETVTCHITIRFCNKLHQVVTGTYITYFLLHFEKIIVYFLLPVIYVMRKINYCLCYFILKVTQIENEIKVWLLIDD